MVHDLLAAASRSMQNSAAARLSAHAAPAGEPVVRTVPRQVPGQQTCVRAEPHARTAAGV